MGNRLHRSHGHGKKDAVKFGEYSFERINHAVVFIKPHACNPEVKAFVKDFLQRHHVHIYSEATKENEILSSLIDDHYSAISQAAVKTNPKELKLTDENKASFKKAFGVDWDQAIEEGRFLNLPMYERYHGELQVPVGETWDHHETQKERLAPGIKVARLPSKRQLRSQFSLNSSSKAEDEEENEEEDENLDLETFVVNGFYESLRKQYVEDGSQVILFLVHFKEKELSWAKFRQEVIGSTDPEKAKHGSLRQQLLEGYKELNLGEKPNYQNNGVHASAGPIEGLHERLLWFDTKLEDDPFGMALLKSKVDPDIINTFLKNKTVTLYGQTDTTFNFTEELDSSHCIRHALDLQKEDPEHML